MATFATATIACSSSSSSASSSSATSSARPGTPKCGGCSSPPGSFFVCAAFFLSFFFERPFLTRFTDRCFGADAPHHCDAASRGSAADACTQSENVCCGEEAVGGEHVSYLLRGVWQRAEKLGALQIRMRRQCARCVYGAMEERPQQGNQPRSADVHLVSRALERNEG